MGNSHWWMQSPRRAHAHAIPQTCSTTHWACRCEEDEGRVSRMDALRHTFEEACAQLQVMHGRHASAVCRSRAR